jgi:hypothetical protein
MEVVGKGGNELVLTCTHRKDTSMERLGLLNLGN